MFLMQIIRNMTYTQIYNRMVNKKEKLNSLKYEFLPLSFTEAKMLMRVQVCQHFPLLSEIWGFQK